MKKAIKTVGTAARHNYNDGEYCEGRVVKVHGGYEVRLISGEIIISTRSRPKAAGGKTTATVAVANISTRSRPKAAGCCG